MLRGVAIVSILITYSDSNMFNLSQRSAFYQLAFWRLLSKVFRGDLLSTRTWMRVQKLDPRTGKLSWPTWESRAFFPSIRSKWNFTAATWWGLLIICINFQLSTRSIYSQAIKGILTKKDNKWQNTAVNYLPSTMTRYFPEWSKVIHVIKKVRRSPSMCDTYFEPLESA